MLSHAVLLVFVLLMQVAPGSPIVTPPNTTTTVVQNNVTVQAPPPDPAAIADASVTSAQAILAVVIAPAPVAWVGALLSLPDLYRTTPPDLTFNHPAIRGLSEQLRVAALGLVALAIFVMGASHALGRGADLEWGRLLFAVVLSLGELAFWEVGVRLNNAICESIGAPPIERLIRAHLIEHFDPAGAVGTVILGIVFAVVALLLLLSLLSRLALLMVLIAIGPLALLCYALPQTEHFAGLYVKTSAGLLFSQVLVVLGMTLAGVLGAVGSGLGGTLLAIVTLLLIGRLPGLLSGAVRGGGIGGVLRTVHYARRLVR